MSDLSAPIADAVSAGHLLQSSADNIAALLAGTDDAVAHASVAELVEAAEWSELNDRFYQKLAFGTGGLRSRSIGKVVTKAERGAAAADARPEFPAVGTNSMNTFNVSRATQGMVQYLRDWFKAEGFPGKPKMVFSHDTRHFSREFAEHCAKVAAENGCDVLLFDGPRSTPQLSFSVREFGGHAGVMLTASHNPPHDNGFKAYFADGAQIVEPHASSIVDNVNALESDQYAPLPADEQGSVTIIGAEADEAYLKNLEGVLLQPELLEAASDLKIVFTNLHGTGGVHVPTILGRLGFSFETVAAQDTQDGDFPTVASPNPENTSAMKMAIDQAEAGGADIIIGTDPDCDRMGAGVRTPEGKIQLLTGNQIGSLLAYYRTRALTDAGIITAENRENATIIKTLVTTDLQTAIAEKFGIKMVNTLTGFKYIGEKLKKYEDSLPEADRSRYSEMSVAERRDAQLAGGTFFVFGGEESYGYLGFDSVRDKDGNGAVVMFAELAAFAKSKGKSLLELLDDVYAEFGYFTESNHAKVFEGAEGAATIKKLSESYAANPPTELDGVAVAASRDYASATFLDEEGDTIPSAAMLFIELEDGRSFAVRPSGAEPKIKYYLFGNRRPDPGTTFSPEDLAAAKADVTASLASLWTAIEANIDSRISAAS